MIEKDLSFSPDNNTCIRVSEIAKAYFPDYQKTQSAMERDHSESLILAATNNLDVLDKALFRRFDDVIEYSLPADEEIIEILERKLNNFASNLNFHSLLPALRSMSHAGRTRRKAGKDPCFSITIKQYNI